LAPLVPAADLDATAEAIRAFLRGLVRWNVRSNLVAAGDRDRLVRRHVVESLACVPLLDHLGGETLIDLGSGGGFPGIPIKLVRPGIRVALLESRRIKSLFLKRTIRELGLSGAEAWQIRIEALATLPENQRTALLLCRQEELSYEEIATVLGCSLSATKSLIHRARESLKLRLKPYLQSGVWEEKK